MITTIPHNCIQCQSIISDNVRVLNNIPNNANLSHVYMCDPCYKQINKQCFGCKNTDMNYLLYYGSQLMLVCRLCEITYRCICGKSNISCRKQCNKCYRNSHNLHEVLINKPHICEPIKLLICCYCKSTFKETLVNHIDTHVMCIAGHDICPHSYISQKKCNNLNHILLSEDHKIHKLNNIIMKSKCDFCPPIDVKLCCRCVEYLRSVKMQEIMGVNFPKVLAHLIKIYICGEDISPVIPRQNNILTKHCDKCQMQVCSLHINNLLTHTCEIS